MRLWIEDRYYYDMSRGKKERESQKINKLENVIDESD